MTKKAQIIIVYDRETRQASYHLEGLSHQEAQRVLLMMTLDNHNHAMAEAARRHHHEVRGKDQ